MNTQKHLFELEPYAGQNSRGTCPGCNKPHEFAFYLNNQSKERLPAHVGRCNRESSCGYHYTPKQYMQDNGVELPIFPKAQQKLVEAETIDYIPEDLFLKTIHDVDRTNLGRYFSTLFGPVKTQEVLEKYAVGRSKMDNGKAVIFWNIDEGNKIRTGKVICYDFYSGKRRKEINPVMIHKAYKPDYSLKLAFFGEHLLNEHQNATVGIVESEKTALIASIYMPEIVWLATGGASGCKWREYGVFKALKGRTVVMFPDFGYFNKRTLKTCFTEWSERAKAIKERMPCKLTVSTLLEQTLPDELREKDLDLADILIKRENNTGMALTDNIDETHPGYPIIWDL